MDGAQRARPYHHGDLRGAVLDAAEKSLRDNGLAQLSLRDLAREIGVSHAAPRRHFLGRQDLLDALAERGFIRLGDDIRSALAQNTTDFGTRIRQAALAFAHFATRNAELLDLMNSAKHQGDASRVVDAAATAFAPIVALIDQGQAQGDLRRGEPESIGLILYATIHGIATLVSTGMVPADRLETLIDTAVEVFLRGAGPVGSDRSQLERHEDHQ